MSDIDEQPTRKRRFDRWRLVSPTGAEVVSLRQLSTRERLRVISPSIVTSLNMMCGLTSVLLAFRGEFTFAAALIGVSILLDIADGGLARAIGATSPFGLQMDSLADLISFGLAPAVLVHTWLLNGFPVLAWVGAYFWLGCAAFRLARFNVTVDPLADKRYFVGLPSPAAAAVVMATVLALGRPSHNSTILCTAAVSIGTAALMVTSVRFRSFRSLLAPRGGRSVALTLALGAVIVAGFVIKPGWTGLVLAYGYVLQAPLGVLTAPLRERLCGPESVAPRRQRLPSVFLPEPDTEPEPPEA